MPGWIPQGVAEEPGGRLKAPHKRRCPRESNPTRTGRSPSTACHRGRLKHREVAVQRELKVPDEKMNPVGGAVALGHPIGATGAVLTVKTLYQLERRQARYGLVTLCIGGGMGIAAVFERVG